MPFVHQFVDGEPDGPVPFHYPARRYAEDAAPGASAGGRCLSALAGLSPALGRHVHRRRLARRARRRASSCSCSLTAPATSFRRFHLTMREIYFSGVLSLIIILVSGLFVGMVLGAAGLRHAAEATARTESLGVLVALSLVRELGPVVAALLFASRAGTAITAEIGLMKATEQLVGDGDDGGRPRWRASSRRASGAA